MEQAGRSPPGIGVAGAGQHRQPAPQGVAGGGMGVVRQRVHEQIGQLLARQMVRQRRHALCEYHPLGFDAARLCLASQISNGVLIDLRQPQHASLDACEQPHPHVEYHGRKLVAVVEAAKHEACFGQPFLRPRRNLRRNRLARVIGQIAVRQMNDLFAVIGLLVERQHQLVGDHIIHEVRAHGARIAEIARLDRGRTKRKYVRPGIPCMTHQIHRDIDFHLAQRAGDVLIAARGHIDEMVECPLQTLAHLARLIRTQGDGERFEATTDRAARTNPPSEAKPDARESRRTHKRRGSGRAGIRRLARRRSEALEHGSKDRFASIAAGRPGRQAWRARRTARKRTCPRRT